VPNTLPQEAHPGDYANEIHTTEDGIMGIQITIVEPLNK